MDTSGGGEPGTVGLTAEQARDTIADILTEGDGVTIAYVDDGDNAGTITISATLGLSDDGAAVGFDRSRTPLAPRRTRHGATIIIRFRPRPRRRPESVSMPPPPKRVYRDTSTTRTVTAFPL